MQNDPAAWYVRRPQFMFPIRERMLLMFIPFVCWQSANDWLRLNLFSFSLLSGVLVYLLVKRESPTRRVRAIASAPPTKCSYAKKGTVLVPTLFRHHILSNHLVGTALVLSFFSAYCSLVPSGTTLSPLCPQCSLRVQLLE